MNGTIIPNTPIAVDFWKLRECPQARLFFLTHLHGDHIAGLTPTWNYPIYCSEVTARLLAHHHQIKDNLLHTLTLDTPHIVYLDKEHKEQMTVTLFDANHCPGAVMFLFEGYFGRILHTGDFRFQLPMLSEETSLKDYKGRIDALYLDNTYCSPMCCFPTRDEATAIIIDIIQNHPEHDIVLGLRSLGKETLLVKIAMAVKEWISVPAKFYQSLQLLNAPDVFQNNDSSCRIRVEPFHKISNKFIKNLNAKHKTIAILPTAIYCGIDAKPFENNDKVFVVPYSDHSSYTELMQFVSFLKPCKIIPVVSGSVRGPFGLSVSDRANMSRFDKYLNVTTTAATQPVPDTVLRFMKGRALVPLENVKLGVKRRKRLTSATVGAKKVKKGVVYDDSPEKPAEAANSPVTNDNELCEKTVDKENVNMRATAIAKTSDTDQNLTKDQTEAENKSKEINADDVNDSEPELTESQGFEYNSDNEETASLPNNEETVDIDHRNKLNIEIQEEEKRLIKLQEITGKGKSVASDLSGELLESSQSEVFSLKETPEIPATSNRKTMVKKPLEFVVVGREKETNGEYEKLIGDIEKQISENKISKNDPNCCLNDDLDGELVDNDSGDFVDGDSSSNYNTAGSSLGEETDWKTTSEKGDADSECESQSILCEMPKKGPKRLNIESKTCSSDKGRQLFHEACSAHLKHDKGTEDIANSVSREESLVVLGGVSQNSNYSVIMINSDSEHSQEANTHSIELSSNLPEAVAEIFNDTLSSDLSEDEHKSTDEMFSTIGDSLPVSETHVVVQSENDPEAFDKLCNDMDDSLPQSKNNGKETFICENTRSAVTDDRVKADKQNTCTLDKANETNKSALHNVSVIKWEPNFARLRKQRFHQILTKFANGIKMQ